LEEVATRGGWNPHLCDDLLRSNAFDLFFERVRDPFIGDLLDDEGAEFYLRWSFSGMPPWERPIALKILEHARVEFNV
jgi:hypothetical protein